MEKERETFRVAMTTKLGLDRLRQWYGKHRRNAEGASAIEWTALDIEQGILDDHEHIEP